MSNAIALTISNTLIREDSEGRYCLNDLHKAAGSNSKHQPSNFLRLDTTKELVEEINQSSEMRSDFSDMRTAIEVVNGGKTPGTYVAKELVYAYAMWISPKFHLQVIRTFDALVTHQPAPTTQTYPPQHLAALQAELLKANPRLQDVLNLTRLGYSQARIGDMLHIGGTSVYRATKRLRDCGFVVCADDARLPVGSAA